MRFLRNWVLGLYVAVMIRMLIGHPTAAVVYAALASAGTLVGYILWRWRMQRARKASRDVRTRLSLQE